MKNYIIVVSTIFLMGCTDSMIGSIEAFGESADVECYSGGQKIFTDKSTGKVTLLEGGGWHYRSTNGNYVRTFADCFVLVK